MAFHSLVPSFKNLSAGMPFVMSSLLRIILAPTNSQREPFSHSNLLCERWLLDPLSKGRTAKLLFHQHLTPTTTTGNAPAEMLLGPCPHSLLDVVRPDLSKTVRQQPESQKQCHDDHAKTRSFKIGDPMFVQNFSPQYPHVKWLSLSCPWTH